MKTKEFIEMLQKVDPTGEGYVRLPCGGAPWSAELKEGYWDGPYEYLELGNEKRYYPHDSILVTSTKGYKVDINTMDVDHIIWDEKGNLDRIKKRVRFDLTYINDERLESYWKHIENEAAFARNYHEKSLIEWTNRTILRYFDESGYEVRQPKTSKIGHYNSMKAYPTGFLGMFKKEQHLCQGECMAIIESGKFYYEEQDEYYVWKYNPEKGQSWKLN